MSESEILFNALAPGEGLRLALARALALFVLGGELIGGSGARKEAGRRTNSED